MRIDVRPPGGETIGRNKVGAEPQVEPSRPDAYTTLRAAVEAASPADSPDAEGWTQILLNRVNGPELDLRFLPQGGSGLLSHLLPTAWRALNDHALTENNLALGTVLFDGPPSACEVAGLREIEALHCIGICAPQDGSDRIDLAGLPLPAGGLQVNIDRDIASPLKVIIPAGATARATCETGPALAASQVFEAHADGSVDLQHPLPLQGPAMYAPDPAARQRDARAKLFAALQDCMPLNAAIDATAWLFARARGDTLDVGNANDQQVALLAGLSPGSVTALQECAMAFGATEGITSIIAPADLCTTSAFARVVQQIPHLKAFRIVLPDGRDADRRMDLYAPAGAAVSGESWGPRVHKARVHLVDAQGVEQAEVGALHGVIYDHTARAKDFPQDIDPAKLQQTAHDLSLNGAVQQVVYDPKSGRNSAIDTVCRHLSVVWLRMRKGHQLAKQFFAQHNTQGSGTQTASKRVFSFENFTSIASIKELANSRGGAGSYTQSAYEQMRDAGAHAIFGSDAFGSMVADELAQLAPGQSKQFAVETSNHMLGLDIRVKERKVRGKVQREYVVNLYDPNNTATHQRLAVGDLAQLRTMNLSRWLGPKLMRNYFSNGAEAIGSLYAWPPADARAKDHAPRLYVSAAQLASGPMLFKAFATGEPELVRKAIRALRDRDPPLAPGDLYVALQGRGWDNVIPGWGSAPPALRAAIVTAHFEEILNFPEHLLPRHRKLELLGPMDFERAGTRLRARLESGETDELRALLDAVLHAPSQVLSSKEKVGLLLPRETGNLKFSEIWNFQPHRVSLRNWPPWHHEHLQAAKLYLTKVLSSKEFSPAEKERLCFSSEGLGASPMAAGAAMKAGNYFAVSALLCGILDSEATPELKGQWIKRSGINLVWLIDNLTAHATSTSHTDPDIVPANTSRTDLMNALLKNRGMLINDPEVAKRLEAHVDGTRWR